MKSISKMLVAITILLSFAACNAQIRNARTETVKIYGNCGMCQTTIEKAGKARKVAKVSWNRDTKMASVTYDSKKTNQDEILKRIALAGYDSDKFRAPDNVYANLPGCCQYERSPKIAATMEMPKAKMDKAEPKTAPKAEPKTQAIPSQTKEVNLMTAVFDAYFAVKDALVQTDGAVASGKATNLLNAIKAVKMDKLPMDVHVVWMKVSRDLETDAAHIAESKDAAHQRDHFMALSKNIYALIKVSKYEQPIYYQFCPMANDGKGANWLSKDNAIKNPYYGAQMLSCGKTVETIR